MSAAPAAGATATAKATTSNKTTGAVNDTKPAAVLEEDDEFEDFPVESESSNNSIDYQYRT